MKYFIVSDVHSNWEALMTPLKEAGYEEENPNHTLIVAGDLFDRGEDSLRIYQWIKKHPRVILIRGNHETLFRHLVRVQCPSYVDYPNGTMKTAYDLTAGTKQQTANFLESKILQEVAFWIQTTFVDYVEFDKYIIVHSSYPQVEDYHNASSKEWDESTWVNPFITRRTIKPEKTAIVGHWGVADAWSKKLHKNLDYENLSPEFQQIYVDPDINVIGLDNTTICTNRCLVYTIETDETPKLGLTGAEHVIKERAKN